MATDKSKPRTLADLVAEQKAMDKAMADPEVPYKEIPPPPISEPQDIVKTMPEKCNGSSIKILYSEILHITQENNLAGGALLLDVPSPLEDDNSYELWFPKKLLSNIDQEAKTIRVWDVFLKDKYPDLYDGYKGYNFEDENQ